MKTSKSFRIIILLILFSLFLASCSMRGTAPEATATVTPIPTFTSTPTITATPTKTATPTVTQTLTPRPNLTATQMYADFSSKLAELYDAKYVTTKDGTYKRLVDYPMELSKINYYDWTLLSDSPSNFVVRSDIAWESASAAADNSGCGFAFHVQEDSVSYIFYVSLKGIVRLNAWNGSGWTRLGGGTYGSAQQSGHVNLTLVVEGTTFKAFVDDQLIKTYQGFTGKILHGRFGYVVLSGTNKSYGTRCKFSNTVLWTLP